MDVNKFFADTADKAKKKLGGDDKVLVREQTENSVRGLKAPGLALRYLLSSEVIPFGRIIGIAGPKASMKSAFGFFLGAYAIQMGGGFELVETESKLNIHYLDSFIPEKHRHLRRIHEAKSVEEAQSHLTRIINNYRNLAEKNPFPLVVGIDSLAGAGTESEYAKINKSGHAERNFPETALLYCPYFKKLSADLAGYDILLYFTNHLKEKPQEAGSGFGKQYTTQGGKAQDFHASYFLHFTKVSDIDLVNREGKLIQIKTDKCGMGPDKRKIQVPVLWGHEAGEDGEPEQRTWWDWSEASSKLLCDGGQVSLPKRMLAGLDIKVASNTYSSKRLGFSGVTGTEMGDAMMADPEYAKEFRRLCGYRKWTRIGTKI